MKSEIKSQDIVLLYKLISLQRQRRALSQSRGYKYSIWEGWEVSEVEDVAQQSEDQLLTQYSARAMQFSTGISKTMVNDSLNRVISLGLAVKNRKTALPEANVKALLEFTVYGIKYIFPAEPGKIVRGIPTTFAAPVLKGRLMSTDSLINVWPDMRGNEKGQIIEPLHPAVPKAVRNDPRLYEYLALVDSIRTGGARESSLAIEELSQRIRRKPWTSNSN